jgi:hypothetical protein
MPQANSLKVFDLSPRLGTGLRDVILHQKPSANSRSLKKLLNLRPRMSPLFVKLIQRFLSKTKNVELI